MDIIARRVPDIAKRDVYVSGSESFVHDAVAMATKAGVAKEALHQEAYSF
jgi:ferredoxin-NADP reductase